MENLVVSSSSTYSFWSFIAVSWNVVTMTKIGRHLDTHFWMYMAVETSPVDFVKPNLLGDVSNLSTPSLTQLVDEEPRIQWPIRSACFPEKPMASDSKLPFVTASTNGLFWRSFCEHNLQMYQLPCSESLYSMWIDINYLLRFFGKIRISLSLPPDCFS